MGAPGHAILGWLVGRTARTLDKAHVVASTDRRGGGFSSLLQSRLLVVNGDRIYVSDAATQQLVALSDTGTVIWKFDDPGEAPGRFGMICSLDARESDSGMRLCERQGDIRISFG